MPRSRLMKIFGITLKRAVTHIDNDFSTFFWNLKKLLTTEKHDSTKVDSKRRSADNKKLKFTFPFERYLLFSERNIGKTRRRVPEQTILSLYKYSATNSVSIARLYTSSLGIVTRE